MAALAARVIVACRCCLVNRHALGILVGEAIEFHAVEGDSLFSDGDFTQKRACVLVEHPAAHTEVGGRFPHPDESRLNVWHLSDPPKFHGPPPGMACLPPVPLICSQRARNMRAAAARWPAGREQVCGRRI